MRQPKPRGAPVDGRRMRSWLGDFTGYRITVTEARIDRWLEQFARRDRDLAARLLDCVEFFTHEQMCTLMAQILSTLPGWNREQALRKGKWRFVAYSGSAGESGDTMLQLFRRANDLTSKKMHELFIYRSELPLENLGPEDTVVFIDDFSGTGQQVCDAWPMIQELLPGGPRIFLVLVACTATARARIQSQTDLVPASFNVLNDGDNVFAEQCRHFTSAEKSSILRYCERADRRRPKGWGECGLLLVFAHTCPNNSIPILHATTNSWEGIFRRHG
jgi:hypothetical protein